MPTTTAPIPADPIALIASLDVEALRDRRDAIDRERAALTVLIRSAARRQALAATTTPTPTPTPTPPAKRKAVRA